MSICFFILSNRMSCCNNSGLIAVAVMLKLPEPRTLKNYD